jgi:hypothetical protein
MQQESSVDAVDSDPLMRRRKMLQQRFRELAAEVEEREQFMSSMQQLQQLKEHHVAIVRGEIAAKVRELGQLDHQISQLDRQQVPQPAADHHHQGNDVQQ